MMVTIVVIAYNHEQYITQTIESIKAIQFKAKIEIIIIDNGSTDQTLNKLKLAAKDLRNVTILYKQQLFISKLVNKAINIAHGQYIMFLQGDEIIHPLAIKILYQIAKQTSVDVVIAKVAPIAELQLYKQIWHSDIKQVEYIKLVTPIIDLMSDKLLTSYTKTLGVALYNRHMLLKINGADDNCYFADFALHLKSAMFSQFIIVNRPIIFRQKADDYDKKLHVYDSYQAIINFINKEPLLALQYYKDLLKLLYFTKWQLSKLRLDYIFRLVLVKYGVVYRDINKLISLYKQAQKQLL